MSLRWWWVLGLVGTLAILFRQYEYDVWKVHHAACKERRAINHALLNSTLCDRGKNELAFRDKVKCEEARKENAWGLWVCTVTRRMSDNTVASALEYARDSWYVFIFVLIVAIASIRYYMSSRADVSKHEAAMRTLERMHQQQQQFVAIPGRMQQQQHQQINYRQHRGLPALQGYRRDEYGKLVHVDNRPALYTLK